MSHDEADNAELRLTVYLAGPLFSFAERHANRLLAEQLRALAPGLDVILPQDFKYDDRFNEQRTFGLIFADCLAAIDRSQCVVAWLDGCDSDSGTSFEAGYAYARKIPLVGIRTDFRRNQERGVNLMLSRACDAFVFRPSFDEDAESLARDLLRAIRKAVRGRRDGEPGE